jgi:hypothetical protein
MQECSVASLTPGKPLCLQGVTLYLRVNNRTKYSRVSVHGSTLLMNKRMAARGFTVFFFYLQVNKERVSHLHTQIYSSFHYEILLLISDCRFVHT